MNNNPNAIMQLERQLKEALYHRSRGSRLRTLTLSPSGSTDFSSNDFLSLSNSPTLRNKFLEIISQSPDKPFGSGGSRLLDGNSTHVEELEKLIAHHHRAEIDGGLLFNSGFDANAGFFACVPQPGDIIVYDEAVHASVHEGMRFSRATMKIKFLHNSTETLKKILENISYNKNFIGNIFVAIESVYSMDGDVAPLTEMLNVANEIIPGGVLFVVDEAHATGVVGDLGRGLVCALSQEKRVFARLHTFGKAMGCNGAIILSTPTVRSYLVNYARPLIYTTALSFPALAAIQASYTLLSTGRTTELQERLIELVRITHGLLEGIVKPISPRSLLLIPAKPQTLTPIISLLTPKPRELSALLRERRLIARPIVFPTVERGKERVRLCIHANNSNQDVVNMVQAVRDWVIHESLPKRSKL
ncbi:putative aminotransferase [Geopyxis carbonaria]|nr:putative aminotransferase [Geopyxis carbonaria]